ncbi:MAG: 4Fe-4S dicluster domain-containing protein [Candidatus Heimdallarchaeota archaeon]|nr:4Fe-4S dicluster domain-containing protein [Candidatus Heimdallarchaeota archaeon]
MTMELLEYSSRDKLLKNKIKAISHEAKPEDCYTCLKCTNGCPASKIFEDFAPHKFQMAAYLGFAEDIINSGVLWYCFDCLTCQTRCPMLTSPAQTITSLTNIAVDRGISPPKAFVDMIKMITKEGAIIKPRDVLTTDFDFVNRAGLGLPSRGIRNLEQFQEALEIVGAFDPLKLTKSEK